MLPSQPAVAGGNCTRTSVGFTPLNDLRTGQYRGFTGGLYPGGSNVRPTAHDAAGSGLGPRVTPRDVSGAPSPSGRIAFLSIGMSNTMSEFRDFATRSATDPVKHPSVVVVNGAMSGQTSQDIRDPRASYWTALDQRLVDLGLSRAQVQVVWLKQAEAGPEATFPTDASNLRDDLRAIASILKQRFPNLWLVYLSSRIYAGHATTNLNPEPFAYQSGFAVKWLIEDQIAGRLPIGATSYPWLAWGPYLWADGIRPRSDGATWVCSDFDSDGTHPSTAGIRKVSTALLNWVHTDPSARSWYTNGGGSWTTTTPPATGAFAVSIADTGFSPALASVSMGWTVRWTNTGTRSHSATDATGMRLFDSGSLARSASFAFTFVAAGRYTVRSTPDTFATMSVDVPMSVAPTTGTTTTAYSIRWASTSLPAGYVSDVQIRRPGSTTWVAWRQGQTATSAPFVPDGGRGTYSFRARLRSTLNGAASLAGAPVSLSVS